MEDAAPKRCLNAFPSLSTTVKALIEAEPDQTLAELKAMLESQNIKVSAAALDRFLKASGFTYKNFYSPPNKNARTWRRLAPHGVKRKTLVIPPGRSYRRDMGIHSNDTTLWPFAQRRTIIRLCAKRSLENDDIYRGSAMRSDDCSDGLRRPNRWRKFFGLRPTDSCANAQTR
jgi:hypothetical protein